METIDIAVEAVPDKAAVEEITRRLTEFNEAALGLVYDTKPLAVIARGRAGALRGGLVGWTRWGWFSIELFWIADEARRAGLGTRLIDAAERTAIARGCHSAQVGTYSFQALGFYRKRGYALCGTLEDFPPGHKSHHLFKRLQQPRDRGAES